ncbi:MAG: iron-sulfur cluster assembly accessory protein [Gammaproteobacteria bacterium]|nr:MAG: iron-sulfur cluster assembly accessory protein [Gammaproteobacteria bacterium]
MITVTPAAAAQIKLSADQGKTEGMSLRIAASRNDDNSIHYGMGFDDSKEDDITVTTEDIEIIVSTSSAELLKNTTIDFVELEPDKFQFIFMNPNDPAYKAPVE